MIGSGRGVSAPHYDTLIVGAGSAGAVLAARLSEDPTRSVGVVEAGPDYERVDQLPSQVRGFDFDDRPYAGAQLSSHEWQYIARATDRYLEMPVPRGRMIGGSSSINGVVFLRALRSDLDAWAAAGNPEWSFERCLPYYRMLETDCDFDDEWHGSSGPIPVRRAQRDDWLAPSAAFFEACAALGYDYCADMNRPDARGVGPIPANYRDSIRHSTAVAYLMPSRGRPNLTLLANTLVTGIRFAGRRACGVQVSRDGQLDEITADQVVLCAGSIGSPQLLLLSGVGPADQVQALGIAPVADLPGVGQHVRDHPYVATVWDTFEPGVIDRRTGLPWQLQVRTTSGLPSSPPDDGWLTMIGSTLRDVDGGRGFIIPSSLMYARSAGVLRLVSAEPATPPSLDFNYLSEPSDLDRLRHLARLALEIGQDPAFDSLRAGLRSPTTDDLASERAFDSWIMRTITTGHHISCTCRMGPSNDPLAVVDQRGRVYGVENLHVVDASIMPDCPSVNLNATVIMMAEKLAEELRRA
jgi:choline dehydrogenase